MIDLDQHISGFERQMRQHEGLSDITVASYCTKVKDFLQFLQWLVQNRPATATPSAHTTRQDVEAYLEHCFFLGNKNQTRLTKLTALRKFFRYLVYENIVPEDITARIPRPKTSKGHVQNFTREEILNLFAAIDINTEKGLRDINVLMLGVFCGLRISEIIKLNTSDIIINDGAIDIEVKKSKHGSSRTIEDLWKSPSLFVIQWLNIRLHQGAGSTDPFLVAYRKGDNPTQLRLTPVGIDKLVKKYATDAKTRKPVITMHMLRATYATTFRYIKGFDIYTTKDRMGHKDISTTERYVPARGRISKEYPSLASYWRDFNHVWEAKD